MTAVVETLIMAGVLHLPDYQLKVFPHLKTSCFESEEIAVSFDLVKSYYDKFESLPTKESLEVELENRIGLTEELNQNVSALITKLYSEPVILGMQKQNIDWMLKTTETHVVNRACHDAVVEAFQIVTGVDKKRTKDCIPDLLKEAVSISFDTEIGHDYIEDFMKRYEFYHDVQERIPFALSMLNHVTSGGICRKAICIPVGGVGSGKSQFMCDWASFLLTEGGSFGNLY